MFTKLLGWLCGFFAECREGLWYAKWFVKPGLLIATAGLVIAVYNFEKGSHPGIQQHFGALEILVFVLLILAASFFFRKWWARASIFLYKTIILFQHKEGKFAEVLIDKSLLEKWFLNEHPSWSFLLGYRQEPIWEKDFLDPLTEAVFTIRQANDQVAILRTLACNPLSAKTAPTLSSALEMVLKHNDAWNRTCYCASSNTCSPEYVKGISNPHAEEIICEALRHPFLYRLNFIKQLGSLFLHVNLDASHHRLPHAFGTAEAAALMFESLVRDLKSAPPAPQTIEMGAMQRTAVIIYALAHDCFHGPMGHSLEPLKTIIAPDKCRKLDKEFLTSSLSPGGFLAELVHMIDPDHEDEIKDWIRFLIERKRNDPRFYNYYFLCEIVDSTLDADRFDFLLRDALHLGQPVYNKNRWIDVLMHARIVQEPEPYPLAHRRARNMIGFPSRYEDRINEILTIRRRFYNEFYESEMRLVTDEMICHLIYYYFEQIGLVDTSKASALRKGFLSEFMKLTDDGLFAFLNELGGLLDEPQAVCLRSLMADIFTNRHFVPVDHRIPPEQVDDAISEYSKFKEEFRRRGQQEYRDIKMQRGLAGKDGLQIIKEVYESYKIGPEPLKWLFGWFMDQSFVDKFKFEQRLWKSLLAENETIRMAWQSISQNQFGTDQRFRSILENVPQVHIIISPVVGFLSGNSEDLREIPFPQDGSDPWVPKVLLFDEQYVPFWCLPSIGYLSRHRPIILSLHPDLYSVDGIAEIVYEKFLRLLTSFEWLSE